MYWLVQNERRVLLLILGTGLLAQIVLTLLTDGGGDLLYAYVPAVTHLLMGQNPYLYGQPWNTSYPLFFFLVLAGIAMLGNIGGLVGFGGVFWGLRFALVIGHIALAGLAYLTLRKVRFDILARLVIPALIVLLPSFYQLGEVWFHPDIFGLLLLTGAVYMLHEERWISGSSLLSLSAAFKIHPILALPLVAAWLFRRGKLSLQVLGALLLPFLALTIIPLQYVPGYYGSFVVQNLSSQPSWSFSPFILAYKVIPSVYSIDVSTILVNQIWISSTMALFAIILGFTWRNWRVLSAADIVCLGVAVWLIPLRQLFHYYAFWTIIPFMMRGKLKEIVLVLLPFEAASDLASYAWMARPDWVVSQQSMGLLLSVVDMLLLVGSIATCACLVLRSSLSERGQLIVPPEGIKVLVPVRS